MELIYYYWITTVEGINNQKINSIIKYFDGLENSWKAHYEDYLKIEGITSLFADRIIRRRNKEILLKEISDIELKGINIITIDNKEYPEKLKSIFDPPLVIYTKGKFRECIRYIAVVGSRKCTSYGRSAAGNLSKILCEYNIGIISGMARGIDTEAHMGAIKAKGFTCAVLGCGCDIVYPPENKKLMGEIETNGMVISEYPPGTKPFPQNFPARNRIISGLSDGILIIEAGEKSGALITANYALEQGRDVYAIPGGIYSDASKGSNKLIKEGAALVTDIYDILDELKIDYTIKTLNSYNCILTAKEKILLDTLSNSPLNIEDLIKCIPIKVNELNSLLTMLEIKGIIKVLPGKYIVRTI